LLDWNVPINVKDIFGRTALHIACNAELTEIALTLAVCKRAALRAASQKQETVVKLLLARDNVEVDSKNNYGQTPLSWAAGQGHEAVVELLLSRSDVEADSKDHRGRTPLWWTAGQGHEAVVELLLARSDVKADSQDICWGQTPLSWSAEQGHEAVVE